MNRRDFLKFGAGLSLSAGGLLVPAAGLFVPDIAQAQQGTADAFWQRDRIINLYRTGTEERLNIRYFRNGKYDYEAYGKICWLMRDYKDQNRYARIDIDLIDSIWGLQEWGRQEQSQEPIYTITSAYRTPRRNATIEGAARDSFHSKGMGNDGRMKGYDIATLAERAKYFKVGGIGQYPTFLHLDSGPLRGWRRG